ncbi:MAG: family 10 glycosylhydrolase [Planctomycetota bacterium]|nr:family 10 glycosylhydrolase [Planctomycetota bacterium]
MSSHLWCRVGLSVLLCFTSTSPAIPAQPAAAATKLLLGSQQPRGERRLIYNSDLSNTTCHLSEPATAEELREIVRNYARVGQIDTLVQEVWHQGWSTFWRSEHCLYDSRFQHKRLIPLLDRDQAPLEIYLKECHKQGMEFIAGIRMNDRHGHNPDLFAQLTRDHPQWVLKEFKPTSRGADPRSREYGCALDYTQQGVRDWLFRILRELASRYDIDGIEFNFTRMPECFPRDNAATSHPIMTGFVRRVRQMLDKVERERGRHLVLGVRVLQDLDACSRVGLDLPTWIRKGLVQYVAPGDIGFTEFNAPYEEFAQLARQHDCFIYPQVEARLQYVRRREHQTPAQYRAAASNIYGAGCDGLSTQNYFLHWGPKFSAPGESGMERPEQYPRALQTLTQLRDAKALSSTDRHFVFHPLWGPQGRGPSRTYQPEKIVLPRTPLNRPGDFRFRLCAQLPSRPANQDAGRMPQLLFKPHMRRGDTVAITINGQAIASHQITFTWPDDDASPPTASFNLFSPPAVYGDNTLTMQLTGNAPDATEPVSLFEIEVTVPGSSASTATPTSP